MRPVKQPFPDVEPEKPREFIQCFVDQIETDFSCVHAVYGGATIRLPSWNALKERSEKHLDHVEWLGDMKYSSHFVSVSY